MKFSSLKGRILKAKQKGFTLVEILLVTGFIAVSSIAIFIVFRAASNSSQAKEEMENLREISNKMAANYSIVGNYTGVTEGVLIANNYAPARMINGGQLLNVFGLPITIRPTTLAGATVGNNAYYIDSPGVPGEVCPKLVSMAAGHFHLIQINGNTIKNIGTQQINPVSLATWCSPSTVTIRFFGL